MDENTEPQGNAPLTKKVTVRGIEYSLVELESKVYDDIVDMVRDPERDRIDTAALLKFMLPKSLVSPAMKDAEINELPMGVRRELLQAVNDLHFPPTDFAALADMLRLAGYKVEEPDKPNSSSGKG